MDPGKAPPAGGKLDELIAESERSLKRLESMENNANRTKGQRLTAHVKRNSGHMINIILAGSVFVVALSRLNDKYAHEAKQEELEERVKSLKLQNDSFAHRLLEADQFALEVEQAAETGGRQLHSRLKEALDSFRSAGGLSGGLLPAGTKTIDGGGESTPAH